jgi:flagellum-specific peptidoglycan hydrolase FlgJ
MGLTSALIVATVFSVASPAGVGQASESFLEAVDGPGYLAAPAAASTVAPPQERAVPSSRGASRSSSPDISTPTKFIEVVGEAAQESQLKTGVPASVTVAQAILESDWAKSGLATKAFNLFGIKSKGRPGPAGEIRMNTWEVFGGKDVVIKDGFRAYHNIYESVEDHGLFLKENARYAPAFKTSDAKEFARRIHAAGYATDPAYSDKLIRLMDKYDLYRFDSLQAR